MNNSPASFMRVSYFFLLIFPRFIQVYATLNIPIIDQHTDQNVLRNLHPHDMGTLHNTIMKRVHDRILAQMPESEDHYSAIMYEEVSALCEYSDYDCKASVHDLTVQSKYEVKELFASKRTFDVHSIVPEGIDPDMTTRFDEIYKSIWTLEADGLEAYHDELDVILDKVEKSSENDFHRVILQSVVSIAKGSGEFWSEVVSNPESVLNADREGRDLQINDSRIGIFEVVSADVVGVIVNSFWAIVYCPLCIFNTINLVFEVMRGALRGAIGYSLAAMGLVVKVPYATDVVTCIGSAVLENADLDILDSDNLLGQMSDFILRPCNSTTLFGPLLGPILVDLFPKLFEFINGLSDESIAAAEPILSEMNLVKNETSGK